MRAAEFANKCGISGPVGWFGPTLADTSILGKRDRISLALRLKATAVRLRVVQRQLHRRRYGRDQQQANSV
jgi:hypothetical protein